MSAGPRSRRDCDSSSKFKKDSIPFNALPDTPALEASKSAGKKSTWFLSAQSSIFPKEVSPTPRLGTLSTRLSATSSKGFTANRKYASASRTSRRS